MLHIRDRRDREAFANWRMRHRRPIPIFGRPFHWLAMAALVSTLLLASCEDFQITDHTVMTGSKPPRHISVPARDLSEGEMIGRWKSVTLDAWPDVGCVLELGSSGRFFFTSINSLICGTSDGSSQSLTGTWRVEESTLYLRLSSTNPNNRVEIPWSLRQLRADTYCLVWKGTTGEPVDPPPEGIIILGELPFMEFVPGDNTPQTVDLKQYFHSDDGPLTFSASSDATIATTSVFAGILTVTPVAPGETTVTVTAHDGSDTVTSQFTVTVLKPPPPPFPGEVVFFPGDMEPRMIDLAGRFPSPVPLTYSAESTNPLVATAAVAGRTLVITPVAPGVSMVIVTGDDGTAGVPWTAYITVSVLAPNVENTRALRSTHADQQEQCRAVLQRIREP